MSNDSIKNVLTIDESFTDFIEEIKGYALANKILKLEKVLTENLGGQDHDNGTNTAGYTNHYFPPK